jgi:hypothetical protein
VGGQVEFEFARGKTQGFIKTKSLGWAVGEWVGGFAKVDNGFGYEKYLQGGSIGFEFARVGEREDKGGL